MFEHIGRRWPWYCCGVTLVLGVLVWLSRPYLASYWIPIQVTLDAPQATRLSVAWGDGPDEQVALVPQNPEQDSPAPGGVLTWVGILPPVPITSLTITVEGAEKVALPQVVMQARTNVGYGFWGGDVRLQPDQLIAERTADNAWALRTREPLTINAPLTNLSRLAQLWLLSSALVVVSLLVLGQFLRPGPLVAASSIRTRGGLRLVQRVCLLLALVYLLQATNAPINWVGGDSYWFIIRGNALANNIPYNTPNGHEFEICKLPGYAFLFALVVKYLGHHITTLIVVQSLLFCGSLYVVGRGLLHYLSPRLTALTLLVMAASPVQLYYCNTVLAESLTVTCCLYAFGCLMEYAVQPRGRGWLWLLGFTVATAAGSMVRVNGLFVAVALLPLAWQQWRSGQLAWSQIVLRTGTSCVLMVLPLTAWSVGNYRVHGVLAPMDMQGIILLNGSMANGVFDPRVPSMEPYYADLSRIADQRWGISWPLRSAVYRRGLPEWEAPGQAPNAAADAVLRGMVAESAQRHPDIQLAGILKSLMDVVRTADFHDASNEVRNAGHSFGYLAPELTPEAIGVVRSANPLNVFDVRNPRGLTKFGLLHWARAYNAFYRIVLAAAFLSIVWSLRLKNWHPLLYAPFMIYLVNVVLLVRVLLPYGRYIQILDVFLVLQVALVFAAFRAQSRTPVQSAVSEGGLT